MYVSHVTLVISVGGQAGYDGFTAAGNRHGFRSFAGDGRGYDLKLAQFDNPRIVG